MKTNVERISSVATALSQQASQAQTSSAGGQPAETARGHADYRLVIEQDEATGSYVYKTLDRNTGEVVSQFPREELMRLKENPAYVAGGVIVTKA